MKTSDPKFKESYKYLLRLLSSILCNAQPPKPNANTDWASVFYAAKDHSVVGMLCYALEKLPPEDLPPKKIMSEFKDIQLSELILESNIQLETEKLLNEFNSKGLQTVLLKGMVLKNYYPISAMRTMSDVDILYREEDKRAIKAIFVEQGYNLVSDIDNELNFRKPPFHHYEMHAFLVGSHHKSQELFKNVWDSVEEKDDSFNLSLEYTYLYMLEHLAKHIECAGAGLRMIMDVFVFLKSEKDNLNREVVVEGLRKLNLLEFEKKIIALAENWFLSEDPDTESTIAQFLLSSSTFGLTRIAFLQSNLRKERKTGRKQNGVKLIIRSLFPSYNRICARFSSAKRFKAFYPFYIIAYWCLRVFKDRNVNTSNLGYYFIKTDSDEADFLLETIKDLGLEGRM